MIEVTGNLWTYPAGVRVITTNGTIKKDGTCVMGRGCALEAKNKWPQIAERLGANIKEFGNVASVLHNPLKDGDFLNHDAFILSFPVKHNWWEKADPDLIKNSAQRLASWNASHGLYTVVMPRPGCGNGNLKWEDVKPILEPILDDRFHVITF